MRKTIMLLVSLFLVTSMLSLSGCIVDPWWGHGGHGHGDHR